MLFCYNTGAQQLQINGYVKQLASFNNVNPSYIEGFTSDPLLKPFLSLFPTSSQDYQIHNRFKVKWYGPKGFSAGLGMRNRLFWGYTTRNYADNNQLYTFLGIDDYSELVDFDYYFDLSITWWENRGSVLYTVFDRLWLQWENNKLRLRAGRQRINWGINTTFNPNDLFNQYNFFDFDYEERPGVDAILAQYYINPYSSLEMAYTPGKDSVQQSVGAVLYRLNKWLYDWQILAGYFRNDIAIGLGWAGNLKNAGFKGEASYFIPLNPNYSQQSLVISTSVDYSLKNGIYLVAGYIYNQLGTADASIENQIGLAGAQLSAKNIFPYKHTLLISGGYNLTALLRLDVSWIQTPDFANAFAVPSLTYSLLDNLYLLVLGQIYFANHPETNKFGFFSSSIFTRIKYSF